MKYICEIQVPDGDTIAKFDAMGKASRDESMWRPVYTKIDRLTGTDLSHKCGSCKHFCPVNEDSTMGRCDCGRVWGPRSRPRCKDYERKKGT